jgi:hypothetical protein
MVVGGGERTTAREDAIDFGSAVDSRARERFEATR